VGKVVKLLLFLIIFAATACSKTENKLETDDRPVNEKILEIKNSEIDTPDNASSAETLLYLMRVDRAMKGMVLITQESILDSPEVLRKGIDLNHVKRGQEIVIEVFDAEMPKLIKDMALLYEDIYSDEELQVMIDFYKTDVGQKFIEKTPDIMAASIPLGQEFQKRLDAQVSKRLRAEIKENK